MFDKKMKSEKTMIGDLKNFFALFFKNKIEKKYF